MNHFDVKAREWERRFFKRFASGTVETGLGRINLVESVSPKQVHFRTQHGKGSHGISRERVRAAIAFFLYRRTTMRKSLEQFNKFSSFLMGLLQIMFVEIAKIRITAKGLRLSLRGTRFTPAGFDRDVRGLELVRSWGQRGALQLLPFEGRQV
ncbi:hypothetical protein ACP26L_12360 [Paenibacillus sp. S-38]|uniref:hypothetical protein n=1 Tax=Paenibacillus sp. S-38 TaxID=3416710 RepID=UPI003CF66BD7